jgi:hypothetical protein
LTLTAYSAQPGSAEEDALKLLASWAASQEQPSAGLSRQVALEPKAGKG